MWSAVAVVSFLVGLSLSRDVRNESSFNSVTKNNISEPVVLNSNMTQKQSRHNRIFDFVKQHSKYRDNVMVMSPPLRITLNKSPQTNDTLFRITRSMNKQENAADRYIDTKYKEAAIHKLLDILRGKKLSSDSKLSISERKLDILRASFDPLDSVFVMSPPLKVTLNNSPQTNYSLYKVARKETASERETNKNRIISRNKYAMTKYNSMKNKSKTELFNKSTSFGKSHNESSSRIKRELSDLNDNLTTPYSTPNQRFESYDVQENYQPARYYTDSSPTQVFQISPPAQPTSRYIEGKLPKDYLSYLMIPALMLLGYAPVALWALKILVYKGLFLSKLAFATAVYLALRTLIFASPLTPVKYYNFGYDNDRLQLSDPLWQTNK